LAFGVIGLILAGFLSGLFGGKHPAEVKAIEVAGGGGGELNGNTDGPGEISIPTGAEAIESKTKNTDPIQPIDPKDLKAPTSAPEPLVSANDSPARLFQEPTLSSRNLGDVARRAQERLAMAVPKGKGTEGIGGGAGGGEGTGLGKEKGPGAGKGSLQHEHVTRQLRWTMIFRTHSGLDYLKQLQDLGAVLATPESNDEYLVYRDLGRRPVVGRKEDIGSLGGRLRWIDDRADSVPALAMSMGLRFKPPYIVAFFPEKLEQELRSLEKQKYAGDENNIEETTFRIEQRPNGKYVPVLHNLRRK
jgi:hypothetical protein